MGQGGDVGRGSGERQGASSGGGFSVVASTAEWEPGNDRSGALSVLFLLHICLPFVLPLPDLPLFLHIFFSSAA